MKTFIVYRTNSNTMMNQIIFLFGYTGINNFFPTCK